MPNFPGGYSIPGVLYGTVILKETEIKAHHDFECVGRNWVEQLMYRCSKCGLMARKNEKNKLVVVYPNPALPHRELTGEETCAEMIIWNIIE